MQLSRVMISQPTCLHVLRPGASVSLVAAETRATEEDQQLRPTQS
jgi:hypothetical protein